MRTALGSVWARAMKLALEIENEPVTGSLTVQWDSPETQDEAEALANAEVKQRIGISPETTWEELGYTKEDIAKFNAEAALDATIVTEDDGSTDAASAAGR